jgi:hypothetical protein
MVTNYQAFKFHIGAKTLPVNVRVNREHKVESIGQVPGASAQQNRALSVRQFAPELDCIDLAWPRHARIV